MICQAFSKKFAFRALQAEQLRRLPDRDHHRQTEDEPFQHRLREELGDEPELEEAEEQEQQADQHGERRWTGR